MRIARYIVDTAIRYGVVELEEDGGAFPDTVSELAGDPFAGKVHPTSARHRLDEVRLLAPVLPRSKVIGVVKNTAPAGDIPAEPSWPPPFFLKPNTSVVGPDEAIQIPSASVNTALEGELAIVIARICRSVPPERVPEVIFGYTVANDITARDLIVDGAPWGAGKCWDTFTPLGPWIATHLSIEEVSNLTLTARIDGVDTTHATTKALIHPVAELVSYLSSTMTLLPGDIILTGAPGGAARIAAGQQISVEIDQIGVLTNPVIGQA